MTKIGIIANSTDYDAWKKDETSVTREEVLKIFCENVHHVVDLFRKMLSKI